MDAQGLRPSRFYREFPLVLRDASGTTVRVAHAGHAATLLGMRPDTVARAVERSDGVLRAGVTAHLDQGVLQAVLRAARLTWVEGRLGFDDGSIPASSGSAAADDRSR